MILIATNLFSPGTPLPVAHAAAAFVFPVMNTSETQPDGVFFRNSATNNDTDRVTGHGVYASNTIQVFCYTYGEQTGPYKTTVWYFAKNVTRPTVGNPAVQDNAVPNVGYINSHYVNDHMTGNKPYPGIPACLPQLSTSGNHIMQNGSPFVFHGVNRDTLEWGKNNWGGCGGDTHFNDSDFDAIRHGTSQQFVYPYRKQICLAVAAIQQPTCR